MEQIKIEYAVTLDRFCKWMNVYNGLSYNETIENIYENLDFHDGGYYRFEPNEYGKYQDIQKWIIKFYKDNNLNKNKNLIIYEIG
jgi:hypothetical protein